MLTKPNQNYIKYFYSFLLMALFLTLLATPALAKPQEVGKILMATVGVTAQQPGEQPRPLARRSPVFLGDTLKTPEGGRAQLRMADGEMLSLTASSELTLEAFDYQPDNQDSKDTNVKRLVTGGLRTITGAVKGDGYEMKNRAGTIGIRGTAFEVYSQQGENLFVRIQRGDIVVANAQGSVDIGVNQRLMAARIGSINQAPEGISLSDLPQFFEDAFAEDTTLSLATGGEQQQASQQDQISEESYSQPTAPAMALQVAQTAVVDNFDDTNRDLERFKEASKQKENTPELQNPNYSGYLFRLNLEGGEFVGGYFKNVNIKEESGSTNISGGNGSQILGLTEVNSFSFSNSVSFSEDYAGLLIDEDSNNSGFWYKFSLGDADIVDGFYFCASECINGSSEDGIGMYHYIFATNALEFDKLSELTTSSPYTYNLNKGLYDDEFLESGTLKVYFDKMEMSVDLNSSDENHWGAYGKIKDFYNTSLTLNKGEPTEGNITGRFVGTGAEGAITAYKLGLGESGDNMLGTAIFKREGVEIGK